MSLIYKLKIKTLKRLFRSDTNSYWRSHSVKKQLFTFCVKNIDDEFQSCISLINLDLNFWNVQMMKEVHNILPSCSHKYVVIDWIFLSVTIISLKEIYRLTK